MSSTINWLPVEKPSWDGPDAFTAWVRTNPVISVSGNFYRLRFIDVEHLEDLLASMESQWGVRCFAIYEKPLWQEGFLSPGVVLVQAGD